MLSASEASIFSGEPHSKSGPFAGAQGDIPLTIAELLPERNSALTTARVCGMMKHDETRKDNVGTGQDARDAW